VATPRSSTRLSYATRSAQGGYDRGIDVLERLVPLARRLERAVRFYGFAVGVAALVIVATVLAVDVPGTAWTWGLDVVLLGLLLIAPVIILIFSSMLREALDLPAQFRALPNVAPARARELAYLVRQAHANGPHEQAGSMARDSWRAGRLLNALRREVPGVSVVLSIARIPFVIMVLIAMLAGLFELFLAPFVVVLAVLTTLV
jgi:hypothetical protein